MSPITCVHYIRNEMKSTSILCPKNPKNSIRIIILITLSTYTLIHDSITSTHLLNIELDIEAYFHTVNKLIIFHKCIQTAVVNINIDRAQNTLIKHMSDSWCQSHGPAIEHMWSNACPTNQLPCGMTYHLNCPSNLVDWVGRHKNQFHFIVSDTRTDRTRVEQNKRSFAFVLACRQLLFSVSVRVYRENMKIK